VSGTVQAPAPAAPKFLGNSVYGDSSGVAAAANPGDFINSTDPRDFMYGRDPNYATDTAAAERAHAAAAESDMYGQASKAINTGAQMGADISGYGQQIGSTLGGMAQTAIGQGAAMQGRTLSADYQGANSVFQVAKNDASQLSALEQAQGPSAAQAQLQSGLNQSQASNLALARSGHGFGGSASALSQAVGANAAAGQQAGNSAAMLKAQEDAAWRARQAQNLQGAAGISSGVANALQGQGLSQAQLQAQVMAENDQAQAALTGQGLQAYGAAGQLGLSGLTSGASATQAGQTLGLQGSQAAAGQYVTGEQMAGINMTAQQQADLTREQGLLQKQGIEAGVAASNQAAVNSGWGTALSTAAAIGGTAITAASDASAKQAIQPLDKPFVGMGTPAQSIAPAGAPVAAPDSGAPPMQPAKGDSWIAPVAQGVGGLVGGAIGTVIAPGAGTVAGGVAGSLAGKLAGSYLSSGTHSSDIHGKDSVQPLDSGGITSPSGPMGYGQINPSGSTQAGMSNAFGAGRDKAALAASGASAADADLKNQAKKAAIASMVGGISGGFDNFAKGAAAGAPTPGQLQTLGQGGFQPGYGMGWGQQGWSSPGALASDAHSKTAIRKLTDENEALKSALGGPPSQAMLNQAAADQDAAAPGARLTYPPAVAPPTKAMLNQAAAAQQSATAQHSDALNMVDEAPGYSYQYKDPAKHGYGQKFGPMAQDLLKTPAGASTVERAPDGTLAVNTGRLALVEHAALHSDRLENAAKFEQLKSEIDAMKGGAVAENGAEGGAGYEPGAESAPAGSGHHFWEVPDYSNGGKYTPIWNLPSVPFAPSQRGRAKAARIGQG